MGLVSPEVWSAPGCHPAGPPHPTRSWQPLGAAQLLARASGHPARPGVGRSILGVWSRTSVSLRAMLCGRQEEERARGVARSPRLRSLRASGLPGSPTQAAVGSSVALSADPWPGARMCLLRGDSGRQGTCQPHIGHTRSRVPALSPASAPRSSPAGGMEPNRPADAPVGCANSSG